MNQHEPVSSTTIQQASRQAAELSSGLLHAVQSMATPALASRIIELSKLQEQLAASFQEVYAKCVSKTIAEAFVNRDEAVLCQLLEQSRTILDVSELKFQIIDPRKENKTLEADAYLQKFLYQVGRFHLTTVFDAFVAKFLSSNLDDQTTCKLFSDIIKTGISSEWTDQLMVHHDQLVQCLFRVPAPNSPDQELGDFFKLAIKRDSVPAVTYLLRCLRELRNTSPETMLSGSVHLVSSFLSSLRQLRRPQTKLARLLFTELPDHERTLIAKAMIELQLARPVLREASVCFFGVEAHKLSFAEFLKWHQSAPPVLEQAVLKTLVRLDVPITIWEQVAASAAVAAACRHGLIKTRMDLDACLANSAQSQKSRQF